MSGYKRVNFYELCRLCASNQQKEKTHIFREEGKKMNLQDKIQHCLALKVQEDDFLPKVICGKCLLSLEVSSAFRNECVQSETMLSTYFNNFRYTEDFTKSGKVYIKDTSGTKVNLDLNSVTIKSDIIVQPQQQVQQSQQLQQQVPNNEVVRTVVKQPMTVQQPIQPVQQGFNYNSINLAPIKTTPSLSNKQLSNNLSTGESLSNITVNSNGEIINISTVMDYDNPCNTNHYPQKVTKKKSESKKQKTVLVDNSNLVLSAQDNLLSNNSNNNVQTGKITYTLKLDDCKQMVVQKALINNGNISQQNISYASNYQQQIVTTTSNHSNLTNNNISLTNNNGINQTLNQNLQPQSQQQQISINAIDNNVYYTTTPSSSSQISTLIDTSGATICQASQTTRGWNIDTVANSINQENQTQQTTTMAVLNTTAVSNNNSVEVKSPPKKLTTINLASIKAEEITVINPDETSTTTTTTSPKSYTCDICSKSFKRREHLYQHVKLHSGFRPFSCKICHKAFMRKEHLLRHLTSHSGQKNFTCTICEKSFSRNDNLLKHRKTHDKQPNYVCDVCNKTFVLKHYYLAHKLTHETTTAGMADEVSTGGGCQQATAQSVNTPQSQHQLWIKQEVKV